MEIHVIPKPLNWLPVAADTLQQCTTPFGVFTIHKKAKRAFEVRVLAGTKMSQRVGSYPTLVAAKAAADHVHHEYATRFLNTYFDFEERW